MFTDPDITQAGAHIGHARNHIAALAYAAKPADTALNTLLATIDQLTLDVNAKRIAMGA